MTVRLKLRVSPRAASTAWAGWAGERIKLRVAAAPEGGRANAALVEFLAERLGIPRAQIAVVAGHASRDKTVEIRGVDPAAVLPALPPRARA